MSSRENILKRIRERLQAAGPFRDEFASPKSPPPPDVWPRTSPDTGVMAERFTKELLEVFGEVLRLKATEEAVRQLPALLLQEGWPRLGAIDTPAAREATSGLAAEQIAWVSDDWTPQQIADLPAALITPECLLADTGSALVECRTAVARLMCYLPPICLIVGRTSQLVEHMPAAWDAIAPQCAETDRRGEHVIITGPSRTADIEKILILGVHGPKRLIVLLVD